MNTIKKHLNNEKKKIGKEKEQNEKQINELDNLIKNNNIKTEVVQAV